MKKLKIRSYGWLFALALLSTINSPLSTGFAQGTAFTYQGRLNNNGAVANGLYDFRFRLASDNQGNNYIGSAFLTNAIVVTNGLFYTAVDFGSGVFTGSNYWLEVDVRTNNPANPLGYTTLNPLQTVTPAPYAIYAGSASNVSGAISAAQISGAVASANLAGTYGNVVTLNNSGNSFTGNGAGLSGVNATALNGLNTTNFWQTRGNAGTTAGVNYLGTSDNQPLELHANGARALRLEPGEISSYLTNLVGTSATNVGGPNIIGGAMGNSVATGSVGCVIGGGGATNWNGSILLNSIGNYSDFSVIGGGNGNIIQTNSIGASISGGGGNNIQANSEDTTISGGFENTIQANSTDATISGGYYNTIQANSTESTIGGGNGNIIFGDMDDNGNSFIGGGQQNSIQTNSEFSFIGSGELNNVGDNDSDSVIAGGSGNNVHGFSGYSVIGGGLNNIIQTNANYSFIGGGLDNNIYGDIDDNGTSVIAGGDSSTINPGSCNSFIGGGENNVIGTNSDHATIGGGWHCVIANNDYEGVIAGGYYNSMSGFSGYSFIGGGQYNSIGTNCGSSTIVGGYGNSISNNAGNSFVAGSNAKIGNYGSFVWSDDSGTSTASTANNSVTFRASGGYRFFTGSGSSGASLAAGATSWTTISDRNAKKNFAAVDTVGVLDKLVAIPIQQWNYKWEKDSDVPNIGPMAQDFKHAFYPGRDDKGISTLEFDGVELAAIQGLNVKLTDELKRQSAENAELQARLDKMEKMLSDLTAKY